MPVPANTVCAHTYCDNATAVMRVYSCFSPWVLPSDDTPVKDQGLPQLHTFPTQQPSLITEPTLQPHKGRCNLHVDMSATTTVALPTKTKHSHCGRERSHKQTPPVALPLLDGNSVVGQMRHHFRTFALGAREAIAWLGSSCAVTMWCTSGCSSSLASHSRRRSIQVSCVGACRTACGSICSLFPTAIAVYAAHAPQCARTMPHRPLHPCPLIQPAVIL
jgi:hypothetical protein